MREDFIPNCRECNDGAKLYKGQRCPFCGCRGKKEKPKRCPSKQDVMRQIHSPQFQEQVKLARRTFQIPENGISREEAIRWLTDSSLACGVLYLWTVEPFQRSVLDIEGQDKREEYFRPSTGQYASLLAWLTYPNNRAPMVEALLGGKLIAARLSFSLGIDNVPEVLLYLLSPELAPPESWKLHKIIRKDPLQRQLERFIQATMLSTEMYTSSHAIREQAEAAAWMSYHTTKGKSTWEENRRIMATLFPPYRSDYTKKHRMRTKLAAKRAPYAEVLEQLQSFFTYINSPDNH